jgi:hypothetical protein
MKNPPSPPRLNMHSVGCLEPKTCRCSEMESVENELAETKKKLQAHCRPAVGWGGGGGGHMLAQYLPPCVITSPGLGYRWGSRRASPGSGVSVRTGAEVQEQLVREEVRRAAAEASVASQRGELERTRRQNDTLIEAVANRSEAQKTAPRLAGGGGPSGVNPCGEPMGWMCGGGSGLNEMPMAIMGEGAEPGG